LDVVRPVRLLLLSVVVVVELSGALATGASIDTADKACACCAL
jgi:hypothetical protein